MVLFRVQSIMSFRLLLFPWKVKFLGYPILTEKLAKIQPLFLDH